MKSTLNIHWKDWCWSWGSNTLATWCKKLTYWKRPWCWERWKAEGEEGDRWWDGWMRSPVQWEKVRNREVWCAAVHGIAESDMISHWTTTTIVQNLPASVGDTEDIGSIPGLGRSSGVRNGNLFQYSCLENSMDKGAWQATLLGDLDYHLPKNNVHRKLSSFHFKYVHMKNNFLFWMTAFHIAGLKTPSTF